MRELVRGVVFMWLVCGMAAVAGAETTIRIYAARNGRPRG